MSTIPDVHVLPYSVNTQSLHMEFPLCIHNYSYAVTELLQHSQPSTYQYFSKHFNIQHNLLQARYSTQVICIYLKMD